MQLRDLLADVFERIEHAADPNRHDASVRVGLDVVDAHGGLRPHRPLAIVGTPPAVQALGRHVALHVASTGRRVHLHVPGSDLRSVAAELLVAATGLSQDVLDAGRLDRLGWQAVSDGIDRLAALPLAMTDQWPDVDDGDLLVHHWSPLSSGWPRCPHVVLVAPPRAATLTDRILQVSRPSSPGDAHRLRYRRATATVADGRCVIAADGTGPIVTQWPKGEARPQEAIRPTASGRSR